MRKKNSSDQEKLLEIETESREFANSERSEQFLVTECFFILFLEVLELELEFKLEKIIGIQKNAGKVRKWYFSFYHSFDKHAFSITKEKP